MKMGVISQSESSANIQSDSTDNKVHPINQSADSGLDVSGSDQPNTVKDV